MRVFDKQLFNEMMEHFGFRSVNEALSARPEGSVYDYSNTQIALPRMIANKIVAFGSEIPDEELYISPEDTSFGREKDPHVTVRYGLDTIDPSRLMGAFNGFGWIDGKLGKVSLFPAGDEGQYDVVKVDIVDCPRLMDANKLIGETEPVPGETHHDYTPHVTIACVKPGVGKKYDGDDRLMGLSFSVNEIMLRAKDGRNYKILLEG